MVSPAVLGMTVGMTGMTEVPVGMDSEHFSNRR